MMLAGATVQPERGGPPPAGPGESGAAAGADAPAPPVDFVDVVVTRDDTVIDRSSRVIIASGTVISDANGDGVLHITAPNVTVEFVPGSVLRGSPAGAAPDTYTGVGIRIEGVEGVTLRNARVSGFKVGIRAVKSDELTIETADCSDNFRQRLASTPEAEDQGDWLWPHANDQDEWTTRWGAGIHVKDAYGVTVRACRVRDGQTALVLDRVSRSRVFDNDFSFNSGWGVAMWRCTRNTVTRNALDFCIRGYSHGVYNRGQDSAGILMFEQCSDNLIAENSATHGGDGLFGFGGKEALGEGAVPAGFEHGRAGCNDNTIVGNDLSYAAAHGLEMTFSFGNLIVNNRLVGNAICGVWGGYSQESTVAHNTIEENGLPGMSEGGGINIEHGYANVIAYNRFARNTVGIALWSDADEGIRRLAWAKANYKGSRSTEIVDNRFSGDGVALRVRATQGTTWWRNAVENVKTPIDRDAASDVDEKAGTPRSIPAAEANGVVGDSRPVGARPALAGRENIIMGTWGPWDHERPMVRIGARGGDFVEFEVYGAQGPVSVGAGSPNVQVVKPTGERGRESAWKVRYTNAGPGVMAVVDRITVPGMQEPVEVRATLVSAQWAAAFFSSPGDPREDIAAFRAAAAGPGAVKASVPRLDFAYGHAGPGKVLKVDRAEGIGADRFGMIATAKIRMPAGRWRVRTLSDDGVRVLADGTPIIENWTHHGPETNTGDLVLDEAREVAFTVEHFELDGYAVLRLDIEPAE